MFHCVFVYRYSDAIGVVVRVVGVGVLVGSFG